LTGAVLYWASLGDADLSFADLSGADLRGAMLYRTICRGTKFCGANLGRDNLTHRGLPNLAIGRSETEWSRFPQVRPLRDHRLLICNKHMNNCGSMTIQTKMLGFLREMEVARGSRCAANAEKYDQILDTIGGSTISLGPDMTMI
jgi:hypothetical protein